MARRARGGSAVVIGAGHNGLVGAILLADAGWEVTVIEEQPRAGGAIASDRRLHPDFLTDLFSAFYPFGAASPVLNALDLGDHGLQWVHAPAVLAHVFPDDRCAVLGRDVDATARSLDELCPGDGAVWRRLVEQFERLREPALRALFTPFPPIRAGAALVRKSNLGELLRLARFAVEPVRRAGDELFGGEGATLLLAGNALHTDLPPEAAGSAVYGWLLAMLGQTVGFPVPLGGANLIVEALLGRLRAAGGQVRLNTRVEHIDVEGGAVTGVRLADGERLATSTVLADTSAPALYAHLLDSTNLPPQLLDDLKLFQWDSPTIKLDWALSQSIPWTAEGARGAGTVHLGVDLNGLTRYASALAMRELPKDPFILLGQMTTSDATRSPEGTESAWAYSHVPEGLHLTPEMVQAHADRLEEVIEARAPGFRDAIIARGVQSPSDLEHADANLVGGAVAGGTAGLHQQLVFRPIPGLGRPETPIHGLYLASASAHPGGGVHGGPGANAAKAALALSRPTGRLRRAALDSAFRRIYR